jgi:hypothetical protein
MLETVNVIEINDISTMSINQLKSFPDTHKGNMMAEKLFTEILKEQGITSGREIYDCVEEGYYQNQNYYLCICHWC